MNLTVYEAAYQSAIYRLVPDAGYLLVTGEDQENFLQRQSTNDLKLVSTARVAQTVLTTATARILDVLTVFPAQTEAPTLAVLTLPGRHTQTLKFLNSRIFFMDRVAVQDLSSQFSQFEVRGPAAASLLANAGFSTAPDFDGWTAGVFQGQPVAVINQAGGRIPSFRLAAPQALAQPLAQALQHAGMLACDQATYEVLRVEAGLPGPTGELTEAYTPLEVNLLTMISDNKGCYTGQEVIARQMNYDKVTRFLVGLRLDAPVTASSLLQAEERAVGEVTSTVISPRLGSIALGVVRRPYHNPGTQVTVETSSTPVRAIVAELPFKMSN